MIKDYYHIQLNKNWRIEIHPREFRLGRMEFLGTSFMPNSIAYNIGFITIDHEIYDYRRNDTVLYTLKMKKYAMLGILERIKYYV